MENDANDPGELESSLTPPESTTLNPDVLDKLFEREDPRVQSGTTDDDSDDDLDFIRMSGLTSPKVSADLGAIRDPQELEEHLAPPVSFYEAGVADVDTAMVPPTKRADTILNPPFPKMESPNVQDVSDAQPPASAINDSVEMDAPPPLEQPETEAAVEPPENLDVAETVSVEPDALTSLEQPETEAVVEQPDNLDVVDLDSFDEEDAEDEVFPDLVLPATEGVDANVVEAPADDPKPETEPDTGDDVSGQVLDDREPEVVPAADATVEATESATEDVESVGEPESVRDAAGIQDDDDVLDAVAETDESNSALDGSIFDDILVDTEHGSDEDNVVSAEVIEAEPTTSPEPDIDFDEPATVQTYGRRSSRHHRRHQPALPRLLKAAAIFIVFGGAIAYGGYQAYHWFEIRVSNPTTLFYEAESAAADQDALRASRLFEEFARRNPDHPLAADALFAAGYQMQQVETEDPELAAQFNDESLALLDEFARRNPNHQRVGRARSLMGIVYYRKGDYRAAVDAFIDRDAILRDPTATLPVLRTLARSYARLGEYEAAHSTFIRAANSPGNPTPDADYDELGEMYRALAQTADTPEKHLAYQELALEHWSHAIRYPGINPTRKNAIRIKVDLLGELGVLKGTPPAVAVQAQNSDLVVPLDAGVQNASFELTTPLPIGPILKGVPGNDEPESLGKSPAAPPMDGGPAAHEFEVVPEELMPAEAVPTLDDAIPAIGEAVAKPLYHDIAPGEQLFQIANQYGVSAANLMEWNQIEDSNHIEAGQRLILHAPQSEDE